MFGNVLLKRTIHDDRHEKLNQTKVNVLFLSLLHSIDQSVDITECHDNIDATEYDILEHYSVTKQQM